MSFATLGLSPSLLKSVEKAGFTIATEIQQVAIPAMLAGKDLLASAQTGTGKTAAFGLPILNHLERNRTDKRHVKVLILAPTRELAGQIQENLWTLGRFSNVRVGAFYGGVSKGPQLKSLHHGLDIVVGTPGRVLDLINTRALDVSKIDFLILDEADQMLDMGFLPDVKTIIGFTPSTRQSGLFSATMPQAIITLSKQILKDPQRIAITPVEQPIERIQQLTVKIEKHHKLSYLIHLLKNDKVESALVFTRTKRGAKRTALNLEAQGFKTTELHGNQSQQKRNEALRAFKEKKVRVLVATDIASRGIDIHQLTHVINFDMPETPEAFLHRTGRTGRAGFSGTVINLVSREENSLLKEINRHTGLTLVATVDPTFVFDHSLVVKQVDEEEESGSFRHPRPRGFGRSASGDRSSSQDGNRPYTPRPEGSSYAKPRSYGPRKPYEGGSSSAGDRPYTARKPYEGSSSASTGDRRAYAPRKPYEGSSSSAGDRPYTARKPYEGSSSASTGERRAYAPRKPYEGGSSSASSGDRPYAAKRSYQGSTGGSSSYGSGRPTRRFSRGPSSSPSTESSGSSYGSSDTKRPSRFGSSSGPKREDRYKRRDSKEFK
jgi:ATP-dependent RNA helicase RhlE